MTHKKIAVLGRGVAGLCCAVRLLEAGFSVTVLGPKNLAGSASPVATGVIAMKGLLLPDTPLFAQKLAGHRGLKALLAKLQAQTGLRTPQLWQGAYELFSDQDEYKALRERIYHRQFTGAFAMQLLSLQQLGQQAPFFQTLAEKRDMAGGFFYPLDGWVEPKGFLQALEAYIAVLGGRVCESLVESVRAAPSGKLRVFSSQTEVWEADEVVVACGAFTNELLQRSALKPLPLVYVPGQTLQAHAPGLSTEVVIKAGMHSLAVYGQKLYWGSKDLPKSRRRVELPSTLACEKTLVQQPLGRELQSKIGLGPQDLAEKGGQILQGVRVMAKDRQPLLGFWPFPNGQQGVWLVCGFHKSGFYLADIFAAELCQMIKNQRYQPSVKNFATARFFS